MAGSAASLDELYRDLYAPVYAHCWGMLGTREDAEDAAHEAFRRALDADLTLERPLAWLLRVATNVCYDELRRRGRERAALLRQGGLLPVRSGDAGDGPAEPAVLGRILARLSPSERALVMRRWQQGGSLETIAGEFGIAGSTARNLLMRARAKVGGELQRYCAGLGARLPLPLAALRRRLHNAWLSAQLNRRPGLADGVAWMASFAAAAMLVAGSSQHQPPQRVHPPVPLASEVVVVHHVVVATTPARHPVAVVVVYNKQSAAPHQAAPAPAAQATPTPQPTGGGWNQVVPPPPTRKIAINLSELDHLEASVPLVH